MSDARSRYERWTKDQLVEEMVKFHRGRSDDQLHLAEAKRDKQRAMNLRSSQVLAIDRTLRKQQENPDDINPLSDLIKAIWDTIEAAEALSSAPIENTMRVTHPTSAETEDGRTTREGARSYRYRQMIGSVRYHIDKTTNTLRNNLENEPGLSEKRRFAAHHSNHKQGYHDEKPNEECPKCYEAAS